MIENSELVGKTYHQNFWLPMNLRDTEQSLVCLRLVAAMRFQIPLTRALSSCGTLVFIEGQRLYGPSFCHGRCSNASIRQQARCCVAACIAARDDENSMEFQPLTLCLVPAHLQAQYFSGTRRERPCSRSER